MKYSVVVIYNKEKEHTGHLYKHSKKGWDVKWNDTRDKERPPEKFLTKDEAEEAGSEYVAGNKDCCYVVAELK